MNIKQLLSNASTANFSASNKKEDSFNGIPFQWPAPMEMDSTSPRNIKANFFGETKRDSSEERPNLRYSTENTHHTEPSQHTYSHSIDHQRNREPIKLTDSGSSHMKNSLFFSYPLPSISDMLNGSDRPAYSHGSFLLPSTLQESHLSQHRVSFKSPRESSPRFYSENLQICQPNVNCHRQVKNESSPLLSFDSSSTPPENKTMMASRSFQHSTQVSNTSNTSNTIMGSQSSPCINLTRSSPEKPYVWISAKSYSKISSDSIIVEKFNDEIDMISFTTYPAERNIRWFIGNQLACKLNKETYNLFRSLTTKKVQMRRATKEEVDCFIELQLLHPSARTATLVQYNKRSCNYITSLMKKKGMKMMCSDSSEVEESYAKKGEDEFMMDTWEN